eukprot:TRINITY_DN120911_c0_g1_i1.p1 TRINITY_DN120911_c0_g1~~TRINITY_DN120911_c0_g1_i1.p1  ORF type:complete len:270 (-),score=81.41 TRINITY_DN120911_c0_g1_i1:207-1016(-)
MGRLWAVLLASLYICTLSARLGEKDGATGDLAAEPPQRVIDRIRRNAAEKQKRAGGVQGAKAGFVRSRIDSINKQGSNKAPVMTSQFEEKPSQIPDLPQNDDMQMQQESSFANDDMIDDMLVSDEPPMDMEDDVLGKGSPPGELDMPMPGGGMPAAGGMPGGGLPADDMPGEQQPMGGVQKDHQMSEGEFYIHVGNLQRTVNSLLTKMQDIAGKAGVPAKDLRQGLPKTTDTDKPEIPSDPAAGGGDGKDGKGKDGKGKDGKDGKLASK